MTDDFVFANTCESTFCIRTSALDLSTAAVDVSAIFCIPSLYVREYATTAASGLAWDVNADLNSVAEAAASLDSASTCIAARASAASPLVAALSLGSRLSVALSTRDIAAL